MRTINDEEFIIPVYTGQYSSLNIVQTLVLSSPCTNRTFHLSDERYISLKKDRKKNHNSVFESELLEFDHLMILSILTVNEIEV